MADGGRVGQSLRGTVNFHGGIEAAPRPSRHLLYSPELTEKRVGDALWRRRSFPAPASRPPDSEHGLVRSEACSCNVWGRATVHQRMESGGPAHSEPPCCVKDRRWSEEHWHGRPGRQADPQRRRRGALCATGVAAINADQASLHEHNRPTPLANNDYIVSHVCVTNHVALEDMSKQDCVRTQW